MGAPAVAVTATIPFVPTLTDSLLVFWPQVDDPGLPPAPGGHGPLVPEQGGHVRRSGAHVGKELEEGVC